MADVGGRRRVALFGSFVIVSERLHDAAPRRFFPTDAWAPIAGVAILGGAVLLWVQDRRRDFVEVIQNNAWPE